tara:strand:+ start:231 stop:710 length:480 start_codon:yes stop_codon:yes gene_type:complete
MKTDQFVKLSCSFLSIPLLLITFTSAALASEVFKWVDEEGITHYDERAPKDNDYSLIKTYGEVPSGSEEAKQRLEQQRADKQAGAAKSITYAEQKKASDEAAKVRAENCKGAQKNLTIIQENARVRILGDDGKLRYLSEDERQSQINKAKNMITANCDS